jgi:hypothetical protein
MVDGLVSGARPRRSWRVWVLLAILGVLGLATMLFAPLEQLLPPGVHVPKIALLIQPALLLVGFAALGWWAAPKTGLDAPLLGALAEGGDWSATLRGALIPSLLCGVVGGLVIAGFEAIAGEYTHGRAQAFDMPLVTRILYGGTVEEIIFRWGLLSLLALAAAKLRARPVAAFWIANLISAALFGAGHIPGIMLTATNPPEWLPFAVFAANFIVGALFGWLFARRGFEAAMIAHGLAHVVSAPLIVLFGSTP